MFGTIRRHQTWLWIVIITLTIISFVVFFSPYQRMNDGAGESDLGTINGKAITYSDYRKARDEVVLYYFLTRGQWPDQDPNVKQLGFDLERETYFRLFLTHKIRSMNIHVSDEAASRLASDIIHSFAKANVNSLETFEAAILRSHNLTVADFDRFVRHEVGRSQLIAALGISGSLVTPQEAETLFRIENEQMSGQVAIFSTSNYMASVSIAPEELGLFYTNYMPRYRVPERVQVDYVQFDATNYFAQADEQIGKMTNFNEQVEALYKERGTNFYSDVKSPQEAHQRIKEEYRKELALRAARNSAAEFAEAVMSAEPLQASHFAAAAQKNGLTIHQTEPFNQSEGPKEIASPEFARVAFRLTPAEPFAGPIRGEDAIYVIALKTKLPSENPPFEQVREQVISDFKYVRGIDQARVTGMAFHQTLTNKLAQGESFQKICGDAKVQLIEIPAFAITTRSLTNVEPYVNLNELQNTAMSMKPGELSEFKRTGEGGYIFHLQTRKPVDDAKLKEELPKFLIFMRQTRQNELFSEWFRKNASEALRDTPVMKQAAPTANPRT